MVLSRMFIYRPIEGSTTLMQKIHPQVTEGIMQWPWMSQLKVEGERTQEKYIPSREKR